MPAHWLSTVSLDRIERRLDPASAAPVWRQLYKALRDLVVDGHVLPGARLPSSRALAAALGISRHSVVTAVEQLVAEGYLVGRRGSGTFVSDHFAARAQLRLQPPMRTPNLSRRGTLIGSLPRSPLTSDPAGDTGMAFRVGIPAVDAFPTRLWPRHLARAWETSSVSLGYRDPLGVSELREEIADYLLASRGLRCVKEQIVVVAGSQMALGICANLLLDPGDQIAVEDPGYLGAHGAFRAGGAQLRPIPVDAEGLDVQALELASPPPRAAYVTPTHQFPTGVRMSIERRMALLVWAERHDAWIIEDDYDSEFRYGSRPLDPLAVLDRDGRVIYIGTFSKVMFPSLRLGYLVLPPVLIDGFAAASLSSTIHPPPLEQLALATFMQDGHFARHLLRTKDLHAERRATLLDECARQLGGVLDVQPAEAGLHLTGTLPAWSRDTDVVDEAQRRGIDVWALSTHAVVSHPNGLLLGYGGATPAQISTGIHLLRTAIERSSASVVDHLHR
ncbi:MAG: PLP-dependent aminotransferase family protein [Ilumatobacteraceae bacterium]